LATDAAVYAGKNEEIILVAVLDSAECCLVQKNQRIVREKECPKTSTKKKKIRRCALSAEHALPRETPKPPLFLVKIKKKPKKKKKKSYTNKRS
jgi:hypothetical protein